jgi:hypothetical protein
MVKMVQDAESAVWVALVLPRQQVEMVVQPERIVAEEPEILAIPVCLVLPEWVEMAPIMVVA